MIKLIVRFIVLFITRGVISCNNSAEKNQEETFPGALEKGTYAYDAELLQEVTPRAITNTVNLTVNFIICQNQQLLSLRYVVPTFLRVFS